MILNGAGQLRSYNQGELLIEDAFKYLIVIDEAHHLINTRDIAQPQYCTCNSSCAKHGNTSAASSSPRT